MSENKFSAPCNNVPTVAVSADDACLIRKIHRIVDGGNNAEVKKGKDGVLKVLEVTKKIA